MVETQSSELSKEILNASKVSGHLVPRNLAGQIVPVIEVNPKIVKDARVASSVVSDATSGSILVANALQDVYICSAMLTVVKDGANTSDYARITCTQGGAIRTILQIALIPSTVGSDALTISFPHAIKIDRNTAVNIGMTNGTASIDAYGSISYFVDECSNA